jgi:hypothetical protein
MLRTYFTPKRTDSPSVIICGPGSNPTTSEFTTTYIQHQRFSSLERFWNILKLFFQNSVSYTLHCKMLAL